MAFQASLLMAEETTLLDKEHIVFPEIDFDKIDEDWGLDVVITTTAETDAEAKSLLGISICHLAIERERIF